RSAQGRYAVCTHHSARLDQTVDNSSGRVTDFYRAINTANAAIGQAPVVQMDSSVKAQRLAEVRFLRALYYFVLVQMYGPLPLQLTETTTPSTEFTRVPVDTVYEQILNDLRSAEANLGYVTKDYGRVTKGAVQHRMAKVYLTRLRDTNDLADEAA